MMHGSLLRLLGFGCTLVLAGACANGDDPSNSGFSITGVSNPTQAGTNPTSESASSTGTPTTGDVGTTAASTSGEDASTTNPASGTTTNATTTGVDPSTTTTTGVDPSTSTTDNTTGTTGEPPPPPPPKDNQPVAGPYEHCLVPEACDANTDLCLNLVDANMKPTDGFCTLLCDSVADCGAKPVCPAVQECLTLDPITKVCALKCAGLKDCPIGMVCANTALGMYCF